MAVARDHRARDTLLAVALAAGASVQLAFSSRDSPTAYVWVALSTLPLAARHRAPVAAGLGVQLAFAIGTAYVAAPELLAQGVAAFLVATYVAALGPRTWAGSCASGAASLALLSLQGVLDTRFETLGAVVANAVYVAMAWAVAAAVRVHVDRSRQSAAIAESAVRTSDEHARQAVLEERARLARELHDVLGHSISVMVMRARGGVHEHRVDPERGLEALRDVEAVGSRALADVRLLLELDNEPGGTGRSTDQADRRPTPGVEDVPALVESTCTTGLSVELRVTGAARAVSDGLGLAVYRVVQESLTNVLRHSQSRVARVALTWTQDALLVEVADPGPARPVPGSGRGLLGMTERVTLVGGTLASGPRPDGGFAVCAAIPVEAPR